MSGGRSNSLITLFLGMALVPTIPTDLMGQECLECHYCTQDPEDGMYLSTEGASTSRIEWEGPPPPPPPEPCPLECGDWGPVCPSPSADLQAAILDLFYREDAAELGLPLPFRAPGEEMASVLALVGENAGFFRLAAEEGVVEVVNRCKTGPSLAAISVPDDQWAEVRGLLSPTKTLAGAKRGTEGRRRDGFARRPRGGAPPPDTERRTSGGPSGPRDPSESHAVRPRRSL